MKIKIEAIFPPIPIRDYDYCAVDDGTYEPGGMIGYGPTPEAAEIDLLRQLAELDKQN